MPIRTIDLFCGAGGSSVGAQSAGANIVAGFDMWDAATKTYKTNFPNARVYSEDIRKLCPKDIRAEIGDIDLILASPECTNHSVAKGAKERDESSRMTAFEVIRFGCDSNGLKELSGKQQLFRGRGRGMREKVKLGEALLFAKGMKVIPVAIFGDGA